MKPVPFCLYLPSELAKGHVTVGLEARMHVAVFVRISKALNVLLVVHPVPTPTLTEVSVLEDFKKRLCLN